MLSVYQIYVDTSLLSIFRLEVFSIFGCCQETRLTGVTNSESNAHGAQYSSADVSSPPAAPVAPADADADADADSAAASEAAGKTSFDGFRV